jgi:hypothetical protein
MRACLKVPGVGNVAPGDLWKAVAINHMARVLNPGGKVFLSDVIFSFTISEYKKYFTEMVDFIATKGDEGLTIDARNHLLQEHSTFDWIIEEMFQRCGFKMISKTVNSATHCEYTFEKE